MTQIDARSQRILELAISGLSASEIAARAGVSKRTVHYVVARHRELLERLREQRLEQLNDRLLSGALEGTEALRRLLADPLTAPALQVKAATALIERAIEATELLRLEREIKEIRTILEGGK